MNVVCLCGRIVRDPETRQTQNGMSVVKFNLAVNRIGKDAGADFISCVAFSKQAEFISKYFIKGMKMDLTGHIQTGSYNDKNGNKVFTTDVVVDHAAFGESRKAAAAEGIIDGGSQPRQQRQSKPLDEDPTFLQVPEDDLEGLPFE